MGNNQSSHCTLEQDSGSWFFSVAFWVRLVCPVSLCRPDSDALASASQVLRLKVHTTMPALMLFFSDPGKDKVHKGWACWQKHVKSSLVVLMEVHIFCFEYFQLALFLRHITLLVFIELLFPLMHLSSLLLPRYQYILSILSVFFPSLYNKPAWSLAQNLFNFFHF